MRKLGSGYFPRCVDESGHGRDPRVPGCRRAGNHEQPVRLPGRGEWPADPGRKRVDRARAVRHHRIDDHQRERRLQRDGAARRRPVSRDGAGRGRAGGDDRGAAHAAHRADLGDAGRTAGRRARGHRGDRLLQARRVDRRGQPLWSAGDPGASVHQPRHQGRRANRSRRPGWTRPTTMRSRSPASTTATTRSPSTACARATTSASTTTATRRSAARCRSTRSRPCPCCRRRSRWSTRSSAARPSTSSRSPAPTSSGARRSTTRATTACSATGLEDTEVDLVFDEEDLRRHVRRPDHPGQALLLPLLRKARA